MTARFFFSFGTMAVLMFLVHMQILSANLDKYLTVEQLQARKLKALSFDRHYAMPIDFCIFPGVVALIIFLCAKQWTAGHLLIAAGISVVVIAFCVQVLWIGGNEAHVHDRKPTEAGQFHAVYSVIVVWAMLMVLVFTPRPEPVLLLIVCIAVPTFFFVGTHMFLGLINLFGAASSYPGRPLKDPVGWSVLICLTAVVWYRSYVLIPGSFWDSLR